MEDGLIVPAPMPIRAIRVGDELWHSAQEKAGRENRGVSDVIRDLLTEWTQQPTEEHS